MNKGNRGESSTSIRQNAFRWQLWLSPIRRLYQECEWSNIDSSVTWPAYSWCSLMSTMKTQASVSHRRKSIEYQYKLSFPSACFNKWKDFWTWCNLDYIAILMSMSSECISQQCIQNLWSLILICFAFNVLLKMNNFSWNLNYD